MQSILNHRSLAVLTVVALAVFGLACEREAVETGDMDTTAVEATTPDMARAMNLLTEDERAEGWELLFDGESFDDWRGFQQDSVPSGWTIEDGAIHFTGENGGGDLITEEEFDDFELALEWKISEGGNSGIIYRADEAHDAPWMTGPEYQLLDNAGHPDAENGPIRQAGANYDMHPPTEDVTRPVGEWNEARIVANGSHVEHWLNGEKIVEYELWTDEWEETVAGSKWSEYPDYGTLESGHIALQDHSDPVWFRNIKVKRLSDDDAAM